MRNIAEEIAQAVTMRQIVDFYHLTPNRADFISCPFHHGDNTPSLKIYQRSFYCFGCGVGGSVIDFVKQMQGTGFRDTCEFIDRAFGLGIVGQKQSFLQYRQAEKNRADRILNEKKQKEIREHDRAQFIKLCIYRRWLSIQPATKDTEFDIKYIDRIFDQEAFISFDADARINALLSKHINGGEFLLE